MEMLSIIIVNYRSADFTIDCIRSVKEFNVGLRAEIIVVDNESGDDSQARVTDAFSQLNATLPVIWIDMGYNAGFSRANNKGIEEAKGSIFLLLNPDTLSIDNSVSRSFYKLIDSPYIACGVQQLNADKTPQISGNFFMAGGVNLLLLLPYWGDFLRWTALKAGNKTPHIKEVRGTEEVDWISGAFLMVKRLAVVQAGKLDPDFFLYAEEVEWCSRLGKTGKLCIFGDEHVIHLQGEAVQLEYGVNAKGYEGLFTRRDFQLMVSNHVRVRKQFGIFWFLFLLFNYTLGVFVYFIFSFLHRLITFRNPVGEWGLAFKFARNVWKLWGLTPKIIVNRPYFYKVL